jgi:hypothetical protein
MFGLMTGSDLSAYYSNNARRKVFYAYPQGTFPLMGLLSLMDETEQLDKDNFAWNEDRHTFAKTTTAGAGSYGPYTDTSGAAGNEGVDLTVAGFSQSVGDTIRIKVTDASVFRTRDFIWVKDVAGAASTIVQVKGIVTAVYTTYNCIDVRLTTAIVNGLNGTAQNAALIAAYGSASVAGGYSKLGGTTFPIEVSNNTQIFRTVVGPFDANVLKAGLKFDSSGIYQHAAKKAKLRHMELLEQAAFWGDKGSATVTDMDDNISKLEKRMGGIYWYLREWELGTTGNGAGANYRPNGSDLTATAWDDSDEKRVCKINGTITGEQFEGLIERAFLYNGDQSWEKLFVGGQGVLSIFNKYARAAGIQIRQMNSKEDSYGMSVTMWETAFGTIYFKTHPLFTNNSALNYSGFILDMGSISYHSRDSRDTTLLTHRQAPDFDGRKDEWLTEYSLEVNFPERHMYIEGLTGLTV